MAQPGSHERSAYLVARESPIIDLMGPTIQLLGEPDELDGGICVMRGTIPPDGIVPLHSHADPETFLMIAGELEGFADTENGGRWLRIEPGGVFHVPGGARHAFRNRTRVSAVSYIVSTPRMARFFLEIGNVLTPGAAVPPVTPETLRHFQETAQRYGYWNATPEENAEIGLALPPLH
jgi:quercetin dioxygenase-like cupin family protein